MAAESVVLGDHWTVQLLGLSTNGLTIQCRVTISLESRVNPSVSLFYFSVVVIKNVSMYTLFRMPPELPRGI